VAGRGGGHGAHYAQLAGAEFCKQFRAPGPPPTRGGPSARSAAWPVQISTYGSKYPDEHEVGAGRATPGVTDLAL
jgi:hypothetical protein